jgi:formate hydrogenlyase subunit 6/NADH:ubiquinone oxidoreductase subunit I
MINELLRCGDVRPVDGLEFTQDFDIAHTSRHEMIWEFEMLEKGPVLSRTTSRSGEIFGSERLEWVD